MERWSLLFASLAFLLHGLLSQDLSPTISKHQLELGSLTSVPLRLPWLSQTDRISHPHTLLVSPFRIPMYSVNLPSARKKKAGREVERAG